MRAWAPMLGGLLVAALAACHEIALLPEADAPADLGGDRDGGADAADLPGDDGAEDAAADAADGSAEDSAVGDADAVQEDSANTDAELDGDLQADPDAAPDVPPDDAGADLAGDPDALGDPDVLADPDVLVDPDIEDPDADPPNTPPVITAPALRRVEVDRATRISGISVSDADVGSGSLEVTLSVTAGTISLDPVPAALTFSNGDGTSDPAMTFGGGLEDVNEALAAIAFVVGAPGAATLSIEVDDQGNTGTGGPMSDSEVVDIEIVGRIFDFNVQRGTTVISDGETSVTLDSGDDYDAPVGPAFVRIVNTRLTGMGKIAGGGVQDNRDFMVYVDDSFTLDEALRFSRFDGTGDVRVSWELIEFTGEDTSPNAIAVRAVDVFRWDGPLVDALVGDGPAVSGVLDDGDVVVFVTGQASPYNGAGNTNTGMFTSEWDAELDAPSFRRLESNDASRVSYAVVELVGSNWSVQRLEHNYLIAGTAETEPLEDPVPSLARTFLHVQHRSARGAIDELGGEVWLSDLDEVSFLLESGATPELFATVWAISNSQTTGDPMVVHHYAGTRPNNSTGAEEDVWTESITSVPSLSRASIFGETARTSGTSTSVPRGCIDLRLTSTALVELRQSDAQENRSYRYSVVAWPDD